MYSLGYNLIWSKLSPALLYAYPPHPQILKGFLVISVMSLFLFFLTAVTNCFTENKCKSYTFNSCKSYGVSYWWTTMLEIKGSWECTHCGWAVSSQPWSSATWQQQWLAPTHRAAPLGLEIEPIFWFRGVDNSQSCFLKGWHEAIFLKSVGGMCPSFQCLVSEQKLNRVVLKKKKTNNGLHFCEKLQRTWLSLLSKWESTPLSCLVQLQNCVLILLWK